MNREELELIRATARNTLMVTPQAVTANDIIKLLEHIEELDETVRRLTEQLARRKE